MSIHSSIVETIGNTPVIRLRQLAPPGVNVFVKVEAANPMGSVKDRAALAIIESAEKQGLLAPGQTVIEASSGNTGISLAMVCAAKGYPLVICMAENFSIERRRLLRFLGARVVLTPASAKGSGMRAKARELAEANGWFLCRQFENEANSDAHYRTTAREIIDDFADTGLDYFVTGFGTGGTLAGVGRALREHSPGTRIVVCEPDNSQLLSTGLPQPRDEDGEVTASHPGFRPHLMQGWSPDFIPDLVEGARDYIDAFMPIQGNDALRCSRELARREGIFAGITAGATLAGALELAESVNPGSNILCMLPDTGERYLTTTLFESIPVEMTDAEWVLSRSTPTARFDTVGAPATVSRPRADADAQADAFIEEVLTDKSCPVVMFAHEWCEFCWSIRKAFAYYGVPYRSIDLDSVEYQPEEMGLRIRKRLQVKTNCLTIPQLFAKGRFLGGCTETFDAIRDGSLVRMLPGIKLAGDRDPYEFLPHWLQPR